MLPKMGVIPRFAFYFYAIATLSEYVSDLAFNNETNEIYGIGWEDNKLLKIDIPNGTTKSVNLDNSSNIYYELLQK